MTRQHSRPRAGGHGRRPVAAARWLHAPPAAQIVPLKSTIRVLDGFGKSLEVILPKLRDGYIVPEANVARGLALENPDAFFLSQAGGLCSTTSP